MLHAPLRNAGAVPLRVERERDRDLDQERTLQTLAGCQAETLNQLRLVTLGLPQEQDIGIGPFVGGFPIVPSRRLPEPGIVGP